MILIRILIGFLIFWLILTLLGWIFRTWLVYKIKKMTQNNPLHRNQNESQITENQSLVQCAQCGTYVVEHQAIKKMGLYYCCQAHVK